MSNQYHDLPISPVTGRPSALTARIRAGMGLDQPAPAAAQAAQQYKAQANGQVQRSHATSACTGRPSALTAKIRAGLGLDPYQRGQRGAPPPQKSAVYAAKSHTHATSQNATDALANRVKLAVNQAIAPLVNQLAALNQGAQVQRMQPAQAAMVQRMSDAQAARVARATYSQMFKAAVAANAGPQARGHSLTVMSPSYNAADAAMAQKADYQARQAQAAQAGNRTNRKDGIMADVVGGPIPDIYNPMLNPESMG